MTYYASEQFHTDNLPGIEHHFSKAELNGAGVVNGISDDMFGIGQNITRQDMCVMLYRIGKYVGGYFDDTTEATEKFGDDSEISDYASEAVYALKAREIINGVDEYNFAPLNTATRAEAAKMIYGMIK